MCPSTDVIGRLEAVIADRYRHRPGESYTTSLLASGVAGIGAKLREEVEELLEAAACVTRPKDAGVRHEAADLVFHLSVLLCQCGVTWDDVCGELAAREGISGLDEKRRRGVRGVKDA